MDVRNLKQIRVPMTLRSLNFRPSPARQGPLFLILAGFLTICATLLFLHAGGVVEGESRVCYPQATADDKMLEVCLESVVAEDRSGGGIRVISKVVANRVILAADRPDYTDGDNLDQDKLHENMSCSPTIISPPDPACIVGGIRVYDSYFDPSDESTRFADELIAFAIREGEIFVPEEDLTYSVCDDLDDNSERKITIQINPVFVPGYGYKIKNMDTLEDTDHTRTVTIGNSDAGGGTTCPGATVTPNLSTGISISPSSLSVPERQSRDYMVKLDTDPGDGNTVRVDITGHSGTDLSLSDDSLDFTGGTGGSWNTDQIVTVTAAQDDDTDDDVGTLVHTASGGDYDGVSKNLDVTVNDNFPSTSPGVTLSTARLTVSEGGSSQNYTVVLDTQPSQDVTITPMKPLGSDLMFNPESVTFTMNDWSNPKSITVTAVSDTDTVNDIDTVTHSLTSTDSVYSGINVDDVTVTVNDDDAPSTEIQLSVSPATVGEGADATNITVTGRLNGATLSSATVVNLTVGSGTATATSTTTTVCRKWTLSATPGPPATRPTALLADSPTRDPPPN